VLQKIKNGEAVSAMEANELAELLHEEHPHITEDLLRQVYKNRKAGFIQFIRHILGIEVALAQYNVIPYQLAGI
jgi:type I restriction enzyme R subunit